jgi:hypothetical protein
MAYTRVMIVEMRSYTFYPGKASEFLRQDPHSNSIFAGALSMSAAAPSQE